MSYLTNPYMVSPSALSPTISDTNLKCYWKCNNSSSPAENTSISSESLLTDGDMTVTGATFEQDSSNPSVSDKSMYFDGSGSSYMVSDVGSNTKSQYNFMHNTSSVWTIGLWIKSLASAEPSDNACIADTVHRLETVRGFGISLDTASTGVIRSQVLRGTNNEQVIKADSSNGFYDGDNAWHWYVTRWDYNDSGGLGYNMSFLRDNANEETFSKSSDPAENGDATYDLTWMDTTGYTPFPAYIMEIFLFNRWVSDADLTTLWNSGNGTALYE
tara:strand:+ start:439 stop:1254 length:816 start_codon:yes stop_codon:yes gene_type:complete